MGCCVNGAGQIFNPRPGNIDREPSLFEEMHEVVCSSLGGILGQHYNPPGNADLLNQGC